MSKVFNNMHPSDFFYTGGSSPALLRVIKELSNLVINSVTPLAIKFTPKAPGRVSQ